MYCGLEAVHGPHHVAEKQRMEYAWDVRNAETADGDSSSWSVADVVMMDCLSFVFFCFLLFLFKMKRGVGYLISLVIFYNYMRTKN